MRTISAKLAAIATAGVVMAAAMMTSALLAALPYVWGGGGGVHLVNAEVGRTAFDTLLAGALLGIAGTGLEALLRSQIAAVVAVAAWVAIGDGVSLSSSDPRLLAGCPAAWPAPSSHPESATSRCELWLLVPPTWPTSSWRCSKPTGRSARC